MKVLLLNGSPDSAGCTYTALSIVADALESEGIDTEICQVGAKPVIGCTGCGGCRAGKGCVFTDDAVNEFVAKAHEADGFIFGSPVHYASASGAVTAFLDRCFYSGSSAFAYKPGACVVSCRRAGSTATLDQLNKYLTISNMPIVSSCYWNMVHGNLPDEVRRDLEGVQIMENLGKNMAWILKCIALGKMKGIEHPVITSRARTNFIR